MQLPTNEVAILGLIKDKINVVEPRQSKQYELTDNKPTSFVEMIINKTKPAVDFEDGRKALLLAETAYKSIQTGKMESVHN